MITWMQRHNKYLVITIWIATIAFIGAGFVGWGSVNFGTKSSSVAEVGDIPISKVKYQFTYSNLYNQYAQKLGANNFDREKAKALGLDKIVFRNLYNQALFLNMANEYGIIVSPEEIAAEIAKFEIFKDKSGQIDKKIYENFLRSRGLKAKDFEAIIEDDLKVAKLLKLIHVKPLPLEKDAMAATFKIADKIKYKILKMSDANVTVSEGELKKYWEKNRANYLTKTKYELELLYTKAKDTNYTLAELKKYYNENSFNYIDKEGKVIDFNSSIGSVKRDFTIKKLKKEAILERNRFKKGKLKATERVTLEEGDKKLPAEIWKALKDSKEGSFLKPKVIDNSYVTVHFVKRVAPQEKRFEEAKTVVAKEYKTRKQRELLNKEAEKEMKDPKGLTKSVKDFLTLSKFQTIDGLTPQESMKVIRYIFGSDKKVDKVNISDGVFIYKVTDQKLLENNNTIPTLDKEIASIKNGELDSNLFKVLASKYSLKVYVKGLQ